MTDYTRKNGLNPDGKSGPCDPPVQLPKCPECASQEVWKDGLRRTRDGDVQRYLCRRCGYRFSSRERLFKQNRVPQLQIKKYVTFQPFKKVHSRPDFAQIPICHSDSTTKKALNDSSFSICEDVSPHNDPSKSTVGKTINAFASTIVNAKYAFEKQAKNLVKVETRIEKRAAGATAKTNRNIDFIKEFPKNLRSKLIEYTVKRINQGCTEHGVKTYLYSLRILRRNGADLHNPENVKAVISRMNVSNRTKKNLVTVYDSFLKFLGGTWQKPKYVYSQKLPFIPLESEIDQLVAGCSKTISTVLQAIKETGARIGEVSKIRWEDIDFKRNVVSINYPEKGSNPRQVKVSSKLIQRLNRLPRKRRTVFANKYQLSKEFYKQRKRLAYRVNNPRIRSIGLHTIRHWHATMEFHRTKNLLHVQQRLGHKNIKNTTIYTHLISLEGDEYHSATAETIEEACKLVDAGFEYVCEINSVQVFRKRK